MVRKSLMNIKKVNATASSGLSIEVILAGSNKILAISHLANCFVVEGKIPND